MIILFRDIKELLQVRPKPISLVAGKLMKELPTIKNAYLVVKDGKIADFGSMNNCPLEQMDRVIEADGKMVLPTWCDSHTHLVYAGNREEEFVLRIKGLTYTEIAQQGGGILHSAKKLAESTEEELYQQASIRLKEVIQLGTGAIEIKSGYGLMPDAELKMLRVIKRLKKNYPIPIKSTLLAAHAIPTQYKDNKAAYLKLLISELIPEVAKKQLAEYIDVFCEKDYFSIEETKSILEAGRSYGLIPKIHVNQFTAIGGVQVGVKYDALSVDHLELMRPEDIQVLKGSLTMPVTLPGCSFFIGIPYSPARTMIDAGLPLALASDYNPGSSPSGNMNFVISMACIKMKMTPEEAINAATINAAYAMGLEKEVGSITVGKRANLILTKRINAYSFLPYSFGTNHIDNIYVNGSEYNP